MTVGSDAHGRQVVVPDPEGSAPGRGAHLHPTTACYELAVRKKAFARALRAPGGPDSGAVATYVAQQDQQQDQQHDQTTEDRPEGWSSSS